MGRSRAWRAMFALAALSAAGGCLPRAKPAAAGDATQAARAMIEKYGVPDDVFYGRLIWRRNGPWKRTIVQNVRPPYVAGGELGVIEQTVDDPLTPSQAADLRGFDGRVTFDPGSGELSAISDREALNVLRLNLADALARGQMSAQQARDFYANVVSLEKSGKTSPYLLSLRFRP